MELNLSELVYIAKTICRRVYLDEFMFYRTCNGRNIKGRNIKQGYDEYVETKTYTLCRNNPFVLEELEQMSMSNLLQKRYEIDKKIQRYSTFSAEYEIINDEIFRRKRIRNAKKILGR